MKNTVRDSQPDEVKIEEIIDSFNRYALRDIRVNIPNPIAAFILASCFIDQMATFVYNPTRDDSNRQNYIQFIKDYLKPYDALKIYDNLRCLLVHGYSLSPNFAISSEPTKLDNPDNVSANNFTVTVFLEALENAFAKFSNDLRSNAIVRKNALDRYKDYPPLVLVDRRHWQYSEKEADYLVRHYWNEVRYKPMNDDIFLKITHLIKEQVGNIYVVKCLAVKNGHSYESNLDLIITQLGIHPPLDALKSAGLYSPDK